MSRLAVQLSGMRMWVIQKPSGVKRTAGSGWGAPRASSQRAATKEEESAGATV